MVAHNPLHRSRRAALPHRPEEVPELEKRAEELARASAPPLLLVESLGVVKRELMGSVSLPEEPKELEMEPWAFRRLPSLVETTRPPDGRDHNCFST
jgi:hypothetical protein